MVARRSFDARQTLVQEGDAADWLFNIVSGTVKLYRALTDGRVQIVGFLGEGDFMGVPATMHHASSAEAVTSVEACAFPRRAFDRLMADSPTLERRLFDLVRNEIVAAQDHLLLLGRKTARERVASFLVGMAAKPRCAHSETPCIVLAMTRSEIADYLGLTMETVSRSLTALKEEGLIVAQSHDRLRLVDPDKLRLIATGSA